MSEAVNQSKGDLKKTKQAAQDNRSSGTQSDLDNIARILRNLEDMLIPLRSEEDDLLQKIYRSMDDLNIKGENADTLQKTKPVQEYTLIVLDQDPDERNVYVKNKLLKLHPSFMALLKERQRVGHLIKVINSQITHFTRQYEKTLTVLQQKQSPSKSDVKRDQIWNRAVSEILMLRHLHRAYKVKSRDLKGTEAYTEDARVVNILNIYQQKFTAFAERNPWVVEGRIVLDLSNPGSDTNGTELDALVATLRATGYSDRLDIETQKYVTEMNKNLNDPYVSKRLKSSQDLQFNPAPGDSLKQATSDFAHFLELTANQDWYTKLTLTTAAEAVERWFLTKTRKLFNNRPYCTVPSQSEEEIAKEAYEAEQRATVTQAQESYQERQERAVPQPGEITVSMVLRFNTVDDDVLKEFLKNAYRLSGTVQLTEGGELYGVGIEFSENRTTAQNGAESRALKALPVSEGKLTVIDRKHKIEYQNPNNPVIMTGYAAISVRK